MLKPARVLFALAVAAMSFSATTGIARGAQAADVVNASPVPGSQLDARGSYYVLRLRPGQTVTQQVKVTNPNSHAVLIDIGAVDASTSGSTGASYGTPRSTPTHTGTWVSFVTQQLQLQPKETRTVPFTVTVPSDIGPGQYLAGVSVAVPLGGANAPNAATGDNAAHFRVTLEPQRILAVEVDVPGQRAPHLVVRGVTPVVQGDTLRLQFDVANTGNAFAKGHGSVVVADTNTRRDFTIDTFVSHTAIEYPVTWTKDVVPGTHSVTIRLQDQTGRIVTWSGPVDVSGPVGTRLQHELAAAKGARLHHAGSTSLRWLAWIIVPICIAAAVHLHRRRSTSVPLPAKAARAKSGGATATPPGAADPPTSGATPTTSKVEAGASR